MAADPPAVRILRQRRIAHSLRRFDAGIDSADGVAAALDVPPETVFKTLVVEPEPVGRKPLLVMVPATLEVDMKKLALALGLRRVRMASRRDAERHTGMRVGGISAIPLAGRGFQAFIAEDALEHQEILVSAGERGADVSIAVADLMAITGATAVRVR